MRAGTLKNRSRTVIAVPPVCGNFLAAQHLAAGDLDAGAGRSSSAARVSSSKPRHRGDGRQRFAAKAESRNGEQVLDVVQFARGMAFEGQHGVVAQHAAAIVDDADETAPGVFDLDADAGSARVDRVFEQFLDDGRGPLHHFAGCDLIGDVIGENPDATHAAFSVSRCWRARGPRVRALWRAPHLHSG